VRESQTGSGLIPTGGGGPPVVPATGTRLFFATLNG
jgi:hypothetical protein